MNGGGQSSSTSVLTVAIAENSESNPKLVSRGWPAAPAKKTVIVSIDLDLKVSEPSEGPSRGYAVDRLVVHFTPERARGEHSPYRGDGF